MYVSHVHQKDNGEYYNGQVAAARASYRYVATSSSTMTKIFMCPDLALVTPVLVGQYRNPVTAYKITEELNAVRPFEHMLIEATKQSL